ncbi:MAG: flavodoxin family protein [Phycisphaerales bacterium]|nr:flavodoxin family protein [Phycisphaerales bacterium]
MKKILGIMGSPRNNGNTDALLSELLAGAEQAGTRTELIRLGEMIIKPCTGCHACWAGKPCPNRDDMNDLYTRIAAADALVFGTPVYWYGPTALMKGFIDRFVYFNCPENRPKIAGKTAAVVIPYEETILETAAPLLTFFEQCLLYLQMQLAGRLIVPGVTKRGEVREHPHHMKEAFDLGVRLGRVAAARFR